MSRAFNFSPGPAALPTEVLQQAQQDLLDFQGMGLSVMEMNHRSPEFTAIASQAEQDLRDLLAIPDNYKVLFVQGGASLQFAMVPLNLRGIADGADYVDTGQWSSKAIKEARRYLDVNVVAQTQKTDAGAAIPAVGDWNLNPNAAYCHYVANETIDGIEFNAIPDIDVPLVADFSSTILSAPLDVSRFGLIYAGAQKNIGPAGVTLVIIRDDLLELASAMTPTMLDYSVHADNGSMYNTPPTFAIYMAGLVFQWIKQQGGLSAMAQLNQAKADALYAAIDNSDFYSNPVANAFRSKMNVPFVLADSKLDQAFLEGAVAKQLLNLKGHRSVGGMRASIYNAVPMAAVEALVAYMDEFEQRFG